MRPIRVLALTALLCAAALARAVPSAPASQGAPPVPDYEAVRLRTEARMSADVRALQERRPGYSFWRFVFQTPDGTVLFGSARDGRLLASFPVRGDWKAGARFEDAALLGLLDDELLPTRLSDRRDRTARLLEERTGPVMHNPARGDFLLPNARRYGDFLEEWGHIYERFGVPADLGLAQAVVESGLAGKARSEAHAIGFCQWLPSNWNRLKKLSPHVIEAENQTTQAPYCAAYLSVLATKYGSFLPALSEHHAGIVNVGRTMINGRRLGATASTERYLVGADFAHDLRQLSPRTFRPLIGSYGPRSYLYSEMVFGNMATVAALKGVALPQRIFAMRVTRPVALAEVAREAGITVAEVSRFNPALVRQVPRGANVYLPGYVEALGPDVSFWHRSATAAFSAVMRDFVALDATPEQWDEPGFGVVLSHFRDRFRDTDCEEGAIMATVLGYVMQEMPTGHRILADFRTNPKIEQLFAEGQRLRSTVEN